MRPAGHVLQRYERLGFSTNGAVLWALFCAYEKVTLQMRTAKGEELTKLALQREDIRSDLRRLAVSI